MFLPTHTQRPTIQTNRRLSSYHQSPTLRFPPPINPPPMTHTTRKHNRRTHPTSRHPLDTTTSRTYDGTQRMTEFTSRRRAAILTERHNKLFQKLYVTKTQPAHIKIKSKTKNDQQTQKLTPPKVPKIARLQPYRTKIFASTNSKELGPTTKFCPTCRSKSVTRTRSSRPHQWQLFPTHHPTATTHDGNHTLAKQHLAPLKRHLPGTCSQPTATETRHLSCPPTNETRYQSCLRYPLPTTGTIPPRPHTLPTTPCSQAHNRSHIHIPTHIPTQKHNPPESMPKQNNRARMEAIHDVQSDIVSTIAFVGKFTTGKVT